MGYRDTVREKRRRRARARRGECRHLRATADFDHAAAEGLDEREIRRRWPRFDGPCPDCGTLVIGYASFAHYVAGDW